jgi:hypothetical protein
MKAYLLKIFLSHFLIFTIYTSIIGYKDSFSNSIGGGIQFWFFVYWHLSITLFLVALANTGKKPTLKKLPVHFFTIILIAFISLLLVVPYWGNYRIGNTFVSSTI